MESEIEFTTQDLYDELIKLHEPIMDLREGAITAEDMSNLWNCKIETARKRMNELVRKGEYTREKAHLGPYAIGYAYYKKTPAGE